LEYRQEEHCFHFAFDRNGIDEESKESKEFVLIVCRFVGCCEGAKEKRMRVKGLLSREEMILR
jgi:hypothetical protein